MDAVHSINVLQCRVKKNWKSFIIAEVAGRKDIHEVGTLV